MTTEKHAKPKRADVLGRLYRLEDWMDDFSSQELYSLSRQPRSTDRFIVISTEDVYAAYLRWATKQNTFPASPVHFGKHMSKNKVRKLRLMNDNKRACYYMFEVDLLYKLGL